MGGADGSMAVRGKVARRANLVGKCVMSRLTELVHEPFFFRRLHQSPRPLPENAGMRFRPNSAEIELLEWEKKIRPHKKQNPWGSLGRLEMG